MAGPDSCDMEHLASDNLLGRIEQSIQSLNGLQQNSFLMPGLCSCDHYTGPDKGANAAMGGSFNQSGFFIHLYLFTLTCEGKNVCNPSFFSPPLSFVWCDCYDLTLTSFFI